MTMRLTMTMVLGLAGLVMMPGCFNPPVAKFHAGKAMEAGDYATAKQKLDKVLAHDPSDWEGHYLMGKAYLGMNLPVEAQTELEQALSVKDRSSAFTPKILDELAEAMYQQQQYEKLYGFLDDQITRYEGWEDYARKARFLKKANDIDGAALAYRQAAFFSRNASEDIYIEIADFYESLGDYDKTLQALKWAYFINDENTKLPDRFRKLGFVPGPTLKEEPPQPEYAGAKLFGLPKVIGE